MMQRVILAEGVLLPPAFETQYKKSNGSDLDKSIRLDHNCKEFASEEITDEFVESLKDKPVLDNHSTNLVVGRVHSASFTQSKLVLVTVMLYADTAAGQDVIRKLQSGQYAGFSAFHRYKKFEYTDGSTKCFKSPVLEVSVCKVGKRIGTYVVRVGKTSMLEKDAISALISAGAMYASSDFGSDGDIYNTCPGNHCDKGDVRVSPKHPMSENTIVETKQCTLDTNNEDAAPKNASFVTPEADGDGMRVDGNTKDLCYTEKFKQTVQPEVTDQQLEQQQIPEQQPTEQQPTEQQSTEQQPPEQQPPEQQPPEQQSPEQQSPEQQSPEQQLPDQPTSTESDDVVGNIQSIIAQTQQTQEENSRLRSELEKIKIDTQTRAARETMHLQNEKNEAFLRRREALAKNISVLGGDPAIADTVSCETIDSWMQFATRTLQDKTKLKAENDRLATYKDKYHSVEGKVKTLQTMLGPQISVPKTCKQEKRGLEDLNMAPKIESGEYAMSAHPSKRIKEPEEVTLRREYNAKRIDWLEWWEKTQSNIHRDESGHLVASGSMAASADGEGGAAFVSDGYNHDLDLCAQADTEYTLPVGAKQRPGPSLKDWNPKEFDKIKANMSACDKNGTRIASAIIEDIKRSCFHNTI